MELYSSGLLDSVKKMFAGIEMILSEGLYILMAVI